MSATLFRVQQSQRSRVDEPRREQHLRGGRHPHLQGVAGPRGLVGGVQGAQLDLHPIGAALVEGVGVCVAAESGEGKYFDYSIAFMFCK